MSSASEPKMETSAAVGVKDAATQEGMQVIDAPLTDPPSATTKAAETVAVPPQEPIEANSSGHDIDIVWHNMLATSDFTTWRKTSRRSIPKLLVDFTALVQQGYLEVINLSVGKSSFVAIVGCEKNWADLQDEILQATR
ncbi:hypothetical protein KCV07_g8527, partial [Aureobasidium melanogenum]